MREGSVSRAAGTTGVPWRLWGIGTEGVPTMPKTSSFGTAWGRGDREEGMGKREDGEEGDGEEGDGEERGWGRGSMGKRGMVKRGMGKRGW